MFVMCCHQVLNVHDVCLEHMMDAISRLCGDGRQSGDGADASDDSEYESETPEILLVPGPDYFRGPSFLEST